jgi:DNA-binding transcriptional LysR family regulator
LRQHRSILNLNMSPRNRWPFIGPGGTSVVAEVDGGLQIDNGEAQLAAALAGAGIVYLPTDLVDIPLREGRLVEVLPHWDRMTLPIHVLYPSRRLVPRRLTAFIEAIATGLKASSTVDPQGLT